jgi:hypothetical protein
MNTTEDQEMSLVERVLLEKTPEERAAASQSDPIKAFRVPVRHVSDWKIHADATNGARVELVLEGVPLATLLGIVNELRSLGLGS